jgi:hypothetical protein
MATDSNPLSGLSELCKALISEKGDKEQFPLLLDQFVEDFIVVKNDIASDDRMPSQSEVPPDTRVQSEFGASGISPVIDHRPDSGVQPTAESLTQPNDQIANIWMFSNRTYSGGTSFADEVDAETSLYEVTMNMSSNPAKIIQCLRHASLYDVFVADNCLLFVHGHDNSVTSAVLTGVQLQDKLGVQVIVFSWPTVASWYEYLGNEYRLNKSGDSIKATLATLLEKSPRETGKVNLLCHSMGNRLGLYAAGMLIAENSDNFSKYIGNIFCAAADVDFSVFVSILLAITTKSTCSVVNYVSGSDEALQFSGRLHNDQRGGYYVAAGWIMGKARVSSAPQYPTILWRSSVNGTSEVGHEYYLLDPALNDIMNVLNRDALRRQTAPRLPNVFWLTQGSASWYDWLSWPCRD